MTGETSKVGDGAGATDAWIDRNARLAVAGASSAGRADRSPATAPDGLRRRRQSAASLRRDALLPDGGRSEVDDGAGAPGRGRIGEPAGMRRQGASPGASRASLLKGRDAARRRRPRAVSTSKRRHRLSCGELREDLIRLLILGQVF